MTIKLGSLFSGSGGFELAGAINGIEPVWASEIEPYPIKVTKARFPGMKHLGSVLDMNGAEVEPVDIITFGSPCQDLSVAGKQAGLHKGERSNLFFEAIRIIKEMRESTDGKYPRIAVWENVPGAYSSNKGEDFRAVLEAFAQIKDETADVPRPASGKWNRAGAIVGNGWSIAWRTFDAQFWGVPQRRKRIYLIADFGSERAGEILFEQNRVRRNTTPGGTAGEGTSGDAEGSVRGSGVRCLNSDHPQSSRIYDADGVYPCLSSNASGGLNRQAVCFQQNQREEVRSLGEQTGAIAANSGAHQTNYVCERVDLIRESRGAFEAYEEDAQASGALKQSDYKGAQVVAFSSNMGAKARGIGYSEEQAPTLSSNRHDASVCYSLDRASFNQGINAQYKPQIEEELASALVARGPSAVCYALEGNGARPSHQGNGYSDSGKQCTLNTIERHGVCYTISGKQQSLATSECLANTLGANDYKEPQSVCYPIDSHQQDSRFKVCADGISPTLPGQMGTGGNNGPMVLTKCAWDGSQVCSTLTANNAGGNQRMPNKDNFNAVIEKVRNDNGDAKKTRCREILLGLWEAYVEKTLQGSVGEQQGLQQTEILRPEVHGRALDKPTENRDKLLGGSCDCESGSGCWVLRNMREAECDGCASQGRQLSEQQPRQFDANLQELPQQATQGGGEVQDLRKESQRVGILREALSKVQEIWKPEHDKSQPVQRKYIIRRLTPLETCRLQGFPDWWEDGAQGSDSARYKMWGNGIALPNAAHVIGCAKKLMQSAVRGNH